MLLHQSSDLHLPPADDSAQERNQSQAFVEPFAFAASAAATPSHTLAADCAVHPKQNLKQHHQRAEEHSWTDADHQHWETAAASVFGATAGVPLHDSAACCVLVVANLMELPAHQLRMKNGLAHQHRRFSPINLSFHCHRRAGKLAG